MSKKAGRKKEKAVGELEHQSGFPPSAPPLPHPRFDSYMLLSLCCYPSDNPICLSSPCKSAPSKQLRAASALSRAAGIPPAGPPGGKMGQGGMTGLGLFAAVVVKPQLCLNPGEINQTHHLGLSLSFFSQILEGESEGLSLLSPSLSL